MFSKRLFSYVSLARVGAIVTTLSGWFGGLFTVAQAYLIATIIDSVFLKNQNLQDIWTRMLLLLGVYFVKAGLVYTTEFTGAKLAIEIKSAMREEVLSKIAELGPVYAGGEKTGELSLTLLDGIESIDAYYSQYLPQLIFSAAIPITMLFFVFPLEPLTGFIFMLTAPLVPFFMILIGRYAESLTQKQYGTLSILAAHFYDVLQGLTTLKIFGRSKAQGKVIREISDHYREITMQVLRVTFLSSLALELLTTLSTAIIAVEIGLRLINGNIQFLQAFFLLIIAPEFYFPLRQLGLKFHAGMSGVTASQRVWQILDTVAPTNIPASAESPQLEFSRLELRNVTYKYAGRDVDSLRDVSMTLVRGNTALIGATGAGKSTVTNLITRFIDPDQGEILIDGVPINQLPIDIWRSAISWVPQSPYLFFDTVRNNLLMAKADASDIELKYACQKAGILDTINALPQGFDTPIGERASFLSGGQAQRVAIARAFLKNAPIILLDEPTSNLDVQTERELTRTLEELTAGKITLTIAHRLNTIKTARMIYLLENGKVTDNGTHEQMIKSGRKYAEHAASREKSAVALGGAR